MKASGILAASTGRTHDRTDRKTCLKKERPCLEGGFVDWLRGPATNFVQFLRNWSRMLEQPSR